MYGKQECEAKVDTKCGYTLKLHKKLSSNGSSVST